MENVFLEVYKPTILSAQAGLSPQEHQLLRLIASKVEICKEPNEDNSYTFELADVYKALGMPVVESHKPLSKIADELLGKTLEFRKGKSFLFVGWISSAKFNLTTHQVSFNFDPHMLTFYQNLRDYFETIEIKAS